MLKSFLSRLNKLIIPKTYTQNLIVEFIGPSGVGKTTLYKEFEKNTSVPFKKPFKKRSYLKYMLYLNNDNYELKNKFIKDYHVEILKLKTTSLFDEDCSNLIKLECLNNLTWQVNQDIISLSFDGLVILDEGIFHNFCYQFLKLAQYNNLMFNSSINKRSFIFLEGEPERIYNQIMVRQNKNSFLLPGNEKRKTDVINMIDNELSERRKLYQILTRYRPCLQLKIENNSNQNIRKIDYFIRAQIDELLNHKR